ncbi:hypothetical protein ACVWWW_000201 [Lysobacter sp. HA18]
MLTRSRIEWRPTYRIVSSRLSPVGVFDDIAAPDDLEALYEIEGLTNSRLREELGQIRLVPADRRRVGPGAAPIMAAFTHLNPDGSRFSNGSYGVYDAAYGRETAISETAHHRARFLARTKEPPTIVEMRCYLADVIASSMTCAEVSPTSRPRQLRRITAPGDGAKGSWKRRHCLRQRSPPRRSMRRAFLSRPRTACSPRPPSLLPLGWRHDHACGDHQRHHPLAGCRLPG